MYMLGDVEAQEACFEKTIIKLLVEIICYACFFLNTGEGSGRKLTC
jgi:hypothetical protein